jgi:hypothetical protein
LEIILSISYTALFIVIIYKWNFFKVAGVSSLTFAAIFFLKITIGVAVWAVYTYYYTYRPTADIFKYFDASGVLFDTLQTHPIHFLKMLTSIDGDSLELYPYYDKMNFWLSGNDSIIYSDNHLIIRINTLIRFFSFGYYQVHTVFFCFFSMIGLTAIYKTFATIIFDNKMALLFSVFGLPSVLFWGSGVLKEGLILGAMGVFIYTVSKRLTLSSFVILIASGLMVGILKFYVLLSLLPSIIFIVLISKTGKSYLLLKYIGVLSVSLLIGLNIDKVSNVQNPLQTLAEKQHEFIRLANGELTDASNNTVPMAGSVIQIPVLEPTLKSFFMNSPQGLRNTLLRPFPWEIKSATMFLAVIENMLIFAILILCLWFKKPATTIRWDYVIACLSFVIIQFTIIGTTTPIIGAIVRYKVPALPFLLIAFLLCSALPSLVDLKKTNLTDGGKVHFLI